MLEVLGEHVMGGAGPLRLVPGFFGADEALTDYAPGRDGWAATLIVTAQTAREARDRAGEVVAELARHEGLRAAPEDETATPNEGGP
jgi:pyrrolysine biosynthesis protein PylC